MYTYRNSFHNTAAKSKYSHIQLMDAYDYASLVRKGVAADAIPPEHRRAYRAGLRLHDKLCGSPNCECAYVWYGALEATRAT